MPRGTQSGARHPHKGHKAGVHVQHHRSGHTGHHSGHKGGQHKKK